MNHLYPFVALVKSNKEIANDVNELILSVKNVPMAKPGQFYFINIFGVGEAAFSSAGACLENNELSFIIKNVGNVSKAITRLTTGKEVGIRGPYGKEWPLNPVDKPNILIMAGGVGIVPLRPLIQQFIKNISKINKIDILYGARTAQDLLLTDELQTWEKIDKISCKVTVDKPDASWNSYVGNATSLLDHIKIELKSTIAYVCGPEVMMQFSALALEKQGLDENSILLSMERNMQCGVGQCGKCLFGPFFICKDGPVFTYKSIRTLLKIREL